MAKKKSTTKKAPATHKKTARKSGAAKPRAAAPKSRSDIQARMHDLVSTSLSGGEFDLATVKNATLDAANDLKSAVTSAMPQDRSNVLRRAFDGLADGVADAAHATRLAIEHAKKTGRKFTDEDLRRLANTMRSMENEFLDAVSQTAQSLSEESRRELQSLTDRARKTGTSIGPAAKDALATIAKHGPDLALETVKAGTRAAAAVVGEVALGVSGLLSGLGSAIKKAQAKREAAAKPAPAKGRNRK